MAIEELETHDCIHFNKKDKDSPCKECIRNPNSKSIKDFYRQK